ncbi:MAG: AbrB/MazE/SpoVT family DNA-binding domain-containing protein [Patescibacteria group bacterium]
MNSILVSKITERGQITLPKRMRDAQLFRDARAVLFTQAADAVVIHPIKQTAPTDDHLSILDHTMRDWTDAENDNLFDFN